MSGVIGDRIYPPNEAGVAASAFVGAGPANPEAAASV